MQGQSTVIKIGTKIESLRNFKKNKIFEIDLEFH